ncbi:acyl-CoA carboxylase subunit epsilon [Microbacterium sp. EST19A]|uniref:acyl-CoA carboxylase subunit epsilon n=1 Tax=Microbacterium sp. EST19A TaxID=2862681 RepID=UPI001CBFCD4E|nr:acyl-CoA carboxylase subunit epsilon [Microbacterium sp. EST19A]
MTDPTASPASPDELPLTLEITRGTANEEELAALIAVITDAYATESADAVADDPVVSAWTQTQRPLRRPLRRDIPWGRFSG